MRQPGDLRVEPGSFAELVHAFFATDAFARLAKSTREGYRRYLLMAADPTVMGQLQLNALNSADTQQFLDGLGHIPGAQQMAKVAIKSMEKWALVRRRMPWPITYGTQVIATDGHHKPWTDDEVAIAEEYARPDIAQIITLGAHTGQRGGDLCKMRWSDIEVVERTPGINVLQEKTNLKLWVPFPVELQAAMTKWDRRAPDFLLLRTNGTPWPNRHNMSEAWIRERDRNPRLRAVRALVLHGLRGHRVVKLRRAGLSPLQVSDMVGMSVPMIENYCKLANQQQSALAGVHFLEKHRQTFQANKSAKNGE